jgi:hypothetical protein
MIARLDAVAGRCGPAALVVLVLGSPVLLLPAPTAAVRLYYALLLVLAAPHFLLSIARWVVRRRDARRPPVAPVAKPPRTVPDEYRVQERRRVLADARELPLADAVFALVEYNDWRRTFGPPPHGEAISLNELDRRVSIEEMSALQLRARRLRNAAYSVGDALLGHDPAYEAIRAAFVSAHPGFSPGTYDRAIHYGCYLAR